MSPPESVRPKRRVKNHLRGESGVTTVKNALPDHWVAREVSPDYGLDLHIETFAAVPGDDSAWDALGEHFFAQVKTVERVLPTRIKPFRGLQSRPPIVPVETPSDLIEVISYSLEIEEIETVRRMGSAVPVVLIVVDGATQLSYYICLNDWIVKILPDFRPDWRNQDTITVHIPIANVLSSDKRGWKYLSVLAKRPKFYGAFAEFNKYEEEMDSALNSLRDAVDNYPSGLVPDVTSELEEYKRVFDFCYFELVDQDIWGSRENPSLALMEYMRGQLEQARSTVHGIPTQWAKPATQTEYTRLQMPLMFVEMFFRSLTGVPRTYGDYTRNWNLPTELEPLLRAENEGT